MPNVAAISITGPGIGLLMLGGCVDEFAAFPRGNSNSRPVSASIRNVSRRCRSAIDQATVSCL